MGNIAHASQDENKHIKGGLPGDQTQKEVCIRSFYKRPWNVVIRANDPRRREDIARFMELAAANDAIGYNQLKRNTLHAELKKIRYDIKAVKNLCDTDCSALVSDACIASGVIESALFIGGNLSTTSTLRSRLKATGMFEIISDSKVVNTEIKMCRGDILLYEGHHTAVYISGSVRPMLRKGDICEDVRVMCECLNNFGIRVEKTNIFNVNVFNALIEFQGYKHIDKDGICGPVTWRKLEE